MKSHTLLSALYSTKNISIYYMILLFVLYLSLQLSTYMQSLHFLSKFGRWSSPRVTNVLKCGYIIQNRFLPITSISHFNPISSSNSFAVMSFFSQKCCHLLSEMHERREKAYFNEDSMLVEDCDTILPLLLLLLLLMRVAQAYVCLYNPSRTGICMPV